jgi:hypothetical protein
MPTPTTNHMKPQPNPLVNETMFYKRTPHGPVLQGRAHYGKLRDGSNYLVKLTTPSGRKLGRVFIWGFVKASVVEATTRNNGY